MDNEQPAVTVLGLGPMGQALAAALLRAGYRTTVWNRTASKANSLVAAGARRAADVTEAIDASPLVIVCVLDEAAVRTVLTPAATALRDKTLVNLTSVGPDAARALAAWAAEQQIEYANGTIMTPTHTIGGPDAVILHCGPETIHQRYAPVWQALAGTNTYLGANPARAASYDVALLDMFWTAVGGVAHGFALAAEEDIPASELAPFAVGIGKLMPEVVTDFAERIGGKEHTDAEATIASALAGMSHVAHAAGSRGLDTGMLDALRATAGRAIKNGDGDRGISMLTETLRPDPNHAKL